MPLGSSVALGKSCWYLGASVSSSVKKKATYPILVNPMVPMPSSECGKEHMFNKHLSSKCCSFQLLVHYLLLACSKSDPLRTSLDSISSSRGPSQPLCSVHSLHHKETLPDSWPLHMWFPLSSMRFPCAWFIILSWQLRSPPSQLPPSQFALNH